MKIIKYNKDEFTFLKPESSPAVRQQEAAAENSRTVYTNVDEYITLLRDIKTLLLILILLKLICLIRK